MKASVASIVVAFFTGELHRQVERITQICGCACGWEERLERVLGLNNIRFTGAGGFGRFEGEMIDSLIDFLEARQIML